MGIAYIDLLYVIFTELAHMTMAPIHKQEPPYTILAEVVRDAEKRNSRHKGPRNQNLKLKAFDFILVTIRAVREFNN